jgi:hypothetical protein
MFSDRVAAWLSDRADAFFKRDGERRGAAAHAEQAAQVEQGEQAAGAPAAAAGA